MNPRKDKKIHSRLVIKQVILNDFIAGCGGHPREKGGVGLIYFFKYHLF